MILYFTGTGNSKYIGDIVAEKTGDSLYSINEGLKQGKYPDISDDEVLIFSLPTYAWRIPRVVSAWIENCKFAKGQKAYFILTCGGDIGNAEKHIKILCAENELNFMGCAGVVMPENYIAMFDSPQKEQEVEIIKNAEKEIGGIIKKIQAGETFEKGTVTLLDKLKSGAVNDMFYLFCISDKKFAATDKCIGCGKCEKLCPVGNITLEKGKPLWHNNCTHCMACISYCPTECIEYGKKTLGKRRYKCKDYL